MSRVSGRNPAVAWIAGALCAGVVAALIWTAAPIVPMMSDFVGETLRKALP